MKADEFINYCVDQQFEQHQIKNNADAIIDPAHEVSFWIKENSIQIEGMDTLSSLKDPTVWEWRIIPTLNLLKWVLDHTSLELDCKFILSPGEQAGAAVDPHRKISLLGYSAPLSSTHLAIPDSHFLGYAGLAGPTEAVATQEGEETLDGYNPEAVKLSVLITEVRHLAAFMKERLEAGEKAIIHINKDGWSADEWSPSSLRPTILLAPTLPPKNNQAIFRGEQTNDQRRRLSYTALGHPLIDIKLTSLNPYDELIWSPFLSVQEHLEYGYILDMYGSANSWDRSCWVLPSSSVLLAIKPSDPQLSDVHTWYSRFLYARGIVPQLTEEELFSLKDFSCFSHLNNVQQSFSSILLGHETILSYMSKFLKRYNEEFNS